MLIVLPVSSADSALVEPFTKALRHFGPQTGHEALIVARPSDKEFASALFEKLEGMFDSVWVHIFEQDGPTGWPKGPNFYWASTIHYLQAEVKTDKPWLWMEMDTTPLTEGWASKLLTEYNLAGKPFMGNVVKTQAVDKDGNPADAGRHLVGVAIYPPIVGQYSVLWRFTPQMENPFDVLCQWETLPHTHETLLMQHGFRTKNYKRTEEGLKGEDLNGLPNGVRFDQPIREGVVLFHGCDDGSLAGVVTGEQDHQPLAQEELFSPAVAASEPPPIDPNLLCPPPKRRAKIAE